MVLHFFERNINSTGFYAEEDNPIEVYERVLTDALHQQLHRIFEQFLKRLQES